METMCRLAGESGSRHLLFKTHGLHQSIAHDMGLLEVKVASDAVLDILDQMSALQGLLPGNRYEFTLARVFGIQSSTSERYLAVKLHLTDLITEWEGKDYLTETEYMHFSQALASVKHECEQVIPTRRDEPLLVAQMQIDIAKVALTARHAWTQHDTLYQATIKPCIDYAFRIAAMLESYRFLGAIQRLIGKHKRGVLRQYEMQRQLERPAAARHYHLGGISRLLRAASTKSERRMLLSNAHRMYAEYLNDAYTAGELSVEDAYTLFELLQDLKQPSLEDSSERSAPLIQSSISSEEILVLTEEGIVTDDFSSPLQETWSTLVAQHLSREDALCLDFFYTNKQIFCFVIEGEDEKLNCRLISLSIHQPGKLTGIIQQWRNKFYSLISQYGSSIETHADIIAVSLDEDELCCHGNILLDPLEKLLGKRHANILYVAPFSDLHGLPIHAVRATSGWCLSDVGPVLHVTKTRQLAEQRKINSQGIYVLLGPEPEFQLAGKELAERIGATIMDPQTRAELHNVLRKSRIAVLLGHGWFDMHWAMRSRIALDHGLRLTLHDLQILGLDGVEVVLLSCWSGWGARGGLPLGELHSGPASWMVGGAGAILAPLWAIPTSAGSLFIGDYLEARSCGETRANALNHARRQSEFYDYGVLCRAAYVLWGRDSS